MYKYSEPELEKNIESVLNRIENVLEEIKDKEEKTIEVSLSRTDISIRINGEIRGPEESLRLKFNTTAEIINSFGEEFMDIVVNSRVLISERYRDYYFETNVFKDEVVQISNVKGMSIVFEKIKER